MVLPLAWTNPILDYINRVFTYNIKSDDNSITPSAIEAARYTVEYICNNYPGPYNLCVSGGIDSQAMIYAWHISNKPFNLYSAVYNNDFNLYDLETLTLFANNYNLLVNYIHLDVLDFLEKEHSIYAQNYLCGSPHITAYMKIADTIQNGTVIFSGNYIPKRKAIIAPENVMGLYHYSVLSGRSCVPFFLCETRELAHSFDQSIIPTLIDDANRVKGYTNKVAIYTYNGFPVIPQSLYNSSYLRDISGQTGFEKVKEYFDDDNNLPRPITSLDKITRLPSQRSNRNFDLLYRNKYETLFAHTKYIIYA